MGVLWGGLKTQGVLKLRCWIIKAIVSGWQSIGILIGFNIVQRAVSRCTCCYWTLHLDWICEVQDAAWPFILWINFSPLDQRCTGTWAEFTVTMVTPTDGPDRGTAAKCLWPKHTELLFNLLNPGQALLGMVSNLYQYGCVRLCVCYQNISKMIKKLQTTSFLVGPFPLTQEETIRFEKYHPGVGVDGRNFGPMICWCDQKIFEYSRGAVAIMGKWWERERDI